MKSAGLELRQLADHTAKLYLRQLFVDCETNFTLLESSRMAVCISGKPHSSACVILLQMQCGTSTPMSLQCWAVAQPGSEPLHCQLRRWLCSLLLCCLCAPQHAAQPWQTPCCQLCTPMKVSRCFSIAPLLMVYTACVYDC